MIENDDRVWGNTQRISSWNLDPSVGALNDGQWLVLNSSGNLVVSAGTEAKQYMTISSRRQGSTGLPNNMGAPIQAQPARDTVSVSGKAIVLIGAFKLATDMYDTSQNYTMNQALVVGSGTCMVNGVPTAYAGILVPQGASTQPVVAHVYKVPTSTADTIGIVHE